MAENDGVLRAAPDLELEPGGVYTRTRPDGGRDWAFLSAVREDISAGGGATTRFGEVQVAGFGHQRVKSNAPDGFGFKLVTSPLKQQAELEALRALLEEQAKLVVKLRADVELLRNLIGQIPTDRPTEAVEKVPAVIPPEVPRLPFSLD